MKADLKGSVQKLAASNSVFAERPEPQEPRKKSSGDEIEQESSRTVGALYSLPRWDSFLDTAILGCEVEGLNLK